MALVDNVLSPEMNNLAASSPPIVMGWPVVQGGNFLRRKDSYVVVPAADTTGSVYRFYRLPSFARITDMKFTCTAMAGLTGLSLGAYYSNPNNTGLVVNSGADFMAATDVHLGEFQLAGYSAVFGSGSTALVETVNSPLWQVLGFTSDPGGTFDICALSTIQTGNAGAMALQTTFLA